MTIDAPQPPRGFFGGLEVQAGSTGALMLRESMTRYAL